MPATDTKSIATIPSFRNDHYDLTLIFFTKLIENGQCFRHKLAMLHHIFLDSEYLKSPEQVIEITVKRSSFPDLPGSFFPK
jgi:hypothetical protein